MLVHTYYHQQQIEAPPRYDMYEVVVYIYGAVVYIYETVV
jgi:hypothetical protein